MSLRGLGVLGGSLSTGIHGLGRVDGGEVLWRRAFGRTRGAFNLYNTGHPQTACVVVMLAVGFIFRFDKAIGKFGPFGRAWGCFESREDVAHFLDCVVADPPNFRGLLEGNWYQGDQGETVRSRWIIRDSQRTAQRAPTDPSLSPHAPFPFWQTGRERCPP